MVRVRKIRRRRAKAPVEQAVSPRSATTGGIEEPSVDEAKRIAVVGDRLFAARVNKTVQDQAGFSVVAATSMPREALSVLKEHRAEMAIVDADFGGPGEGVAFARQMNERSPGSAFMIVCGPMTSALARTLWIYGTDSWSFLTSATVKNPGLFSEAAGSAVRGITWVEPGIQRVLREFGPRPPTVEERRLSFLDGDRPISA